MEQPGIRCQNSGKHPPGVKRVLSDVISKLKKEIADLKYRLSRFSKGLGAMVSVRATVEPLTTAIGDTPAIFVAVLSGLPIINQALTWPPFTAQPAGSH